MRAIFSPTGMLILGLLNAGGAIMLYRDGNIGAAFFCTFFAGYGLSAWLRGAKA